jgi:hypothetical protein
LLRPGEVVDVEVVVEIVGVVVVDLVVVVDDGELGLLDDEVVVVLEDKGGLERSSSLPKSENQS